MESEKWILSFIWILRKWRILETPLEKNKMSELYLTYQVSWSNHSNQNIMVFMWRRTDPPAKQKNWVWKQPDPPEHFLLDKCGTRMGEGQSLKINWSYTQERNGANSYFTLFTKFNSNCESISERQMEIFFLENNVRDCPHGFRIQIYFQWRFIKH